MGEQSDCRNWKPGDWRPSFAGREEKSKMQPFLDWYQVWPGAVRYDPQDASGHSSEPIRGVKLEVVQAEKGDIIFSPEYPWEGCIGYTSLVKCDQGFKMWYNTHAGNYSDGYLCYAESEDGIHWNKPNLGLYEYSGSRQNNIVYPKAIEGSVFADMKEGGYKLLDHGEPRKGGRARYGVLQGAVSADGIHWTQNEDILMDMYCDTQNMALFDPSRGRYVSYVRFARGSRRAIGRTEGPEFKDWPVPQVVMEPDAQDPPNIDFYTNAYSLYPGYSREKKEQSFDAMGRPVLSQDFHLMFPSIYHRAQDVLDVQLAVSRDGLQWSRPERKPVISRGEEGSGEAGGIYVAPGIHRLKDNRWGVVYVGRDRLHNEGYAGLPAESGGQIRWATWEANRLAGLRAPGEACFTLTPRVCSGEELLLNFRTERNGWIRLEIIPGDGLWPPEPGEPFAGYSFADCALLEGDCLKRAVAWNGETSLQELKGERIAIRVKMMRAWLFAISF